MMDILWLDVRYALRTLRRGPLFALGVAATIGLGLGFAGSAFTVVNAYVLKPFEIRDPHRVFELGWDSLSERRHAFTLDDLTALGGGTPVFEDVFAFGHAQVSDNTVSVFGQFVTGNYFSALGIRPFLGRLIDDADAARPGERAVAVLSHEGWIGRYGADPSILGREIRLGRATYTVIGVAQPGFSGFGGTLLTFWVPITMAGQLPVRDPYGPDRPAVLDVLVRTRRGIAATTAAAWFDTWIKQRYSAGVPELGVTASSFESRATWIPLNGKTLTLFSMIEAAFALVLLIACANVANLMLARGMTRQREIAVRMSLGASRARVIRQLFIESVLLSFPAAAVGYLLTMAAARVVPALITRTWPDALPPVAAFLAPMAPDARVLTFLIAGALAAATLFGLIPAWQSSRTSLTSASRGEFVAGVRASRVRSALVVAQIGASAVFLVVAVGVMSELRRLSSIDTGLAIDGVADVRVPPEYRRAVGEHLAGDPRIAAVAAVWRPPLYGPLWTLFVSPHGRSDITPVGMLVASPEYFEVLGVPLVAGRTFTREEGERRAEVAVISEATARRFWPNGDAIGQLLEIRDATRRLPAGQRVTQTSARVIGIARDVTSGALVDGHDQTCVYLPTAINGDGPHALLVRTRSDMTALHAALVDATKDTREDAAFPLLPMRKVVGLQLWVMGVFSASAASLAVIGLLFAISGTYAVTAFIVSQRTREFGIRIALGATSRDIVRGVMMDAAGLGGLGVAIGATLALGLSQFLSAVTEILPTFGVQPYALGVAAILGATLAAASIPSSRASRVDPCEALRAD